MSPNLRELALIARVADRIVQNIHDCVVNGRYVVDYRDVDDLLLSIEYKKYFQYIVGEVASRDEVYVMGASAITGEISCICNPE